ncbi:GyrI-like domain-containing protein [Fulvivirgaceae bacterium BMA12]|uniref:GyrI-like domain-containing protein n=1 Tax=Agaribacillus aureus TaxID=3051825 RepID=A0ABT8LC97_9BACT|nr:GyrI-like domain-containing protein [Fulvivirgaceae bacterium BMA12]
MNTLKLDLIKSHPAYYKAKRTPRIVELDTYKYLTISGQSAPEDPLFTGAIEAIYPVAFAIKFVFKEEDQDFVVPKMEGQWWVDDERPFEQVPRNEWHWRILMRMPQFVDSNTVEMVKEKLLKKGKTARINDVGFQTLREGKCIQMLHIGSYEEEEKTIEQILQKMQEENLQMNGYHHEIYISDPMRTPSWKLKTIIRYPVK